MGGYQVLFSLKKGELFDEHTPAFYLNRPEIVGAKSLYGYQVIGDPKFRYVKIPKSYPLDLNKGFEKHRFYCERNTKDGMAQILQHVMENETDALGDIHATATNQSSHILTQRGVLCRIMLLPYRLRPSGDNDRAIYAIKYNNVICLSHAYEDESVKTKNDAYHFKFEQYCSAESPDEEPNTDEPVDENCMNSCIYRTKLKDFNILYSGEMKLMLSDRKLNDFSNLEELNKARFAFTKLIWDRPQFNLAKEAKCLNWWIQSYLSNVDDIYFARKRSNGYIHAPVKHIHAKDLTKNCIWKPRTSIRFLHQFLTMVQDTMSSENCPYTVYEFLYDPKLLCIKYKIHRGRTELSFLPDEFIEMLRNRNL